jgi:hypothetical protein
MDSAARVPRSAENSVMDCGLRSPSIWKSARCRLVTNWESKGTVSWPNMAARREE